MAELSERTVTGAVSVTADGHVEIRRDSYILRGSEIVAGPKYHRRVLAPGAGLSGEDERVAAIARAAWTEEVVAAYRARLEAAA